MNKIGIICLLPEKIQKYQQELRQKISLQFGIDGIASSTIPAHITLKYPFPVENINEIEKTVQDFSISQRKTKWLLHGFNSFQNGDNYVIFIDVVASTEIRKTHARFLDELRKISWVKWGQFDNADLHYHVTLGNQGITSVNFKEIWSFINEQERPNFEAFFDNISLVQINEYSRSVYKTYQLHN